MAVVSWNTRDLLVRCLESFKPDVDRGLADVWVLDNASTDGSAELVRERFGWVNLIASDENLGFGPALNVIADRTSSEWIVVANADIAVHPGALETLLETGARDPSTGVIAPRLMMPTGRPQHSVMAFPTIPFALLLAVGAFRFDSSVADRMAFPGKWNMDRRRRVPWALGAFLLVRRAAWDEVGGFDPKQWMYAEDLDFGWRLRDAGWATRYEPLAVVQHEVAASTSQQFGTVRAPVWQHATYGCIARRRGPRYARVIALINLIGGLARWPVKYARAQREANPGQAHADYRRWLMVHVDAINPHERLEERT